MPLPKLRIHATKDIGGTTVELDGVPLRCFALTLEGKAGEPFVATVQMWVTPEVDLPADVKCEVVDVTALADEARSYKRIPCEDS